MPHFINHAVYNLDQTVAVTDNPFYNIAIEESAFQLFKGGNKYPRGNEYSRIEDFRINLHPGSFQIFEQPSQKGVKFINSLCNGKIFILQDSLQKQSSDDIMI